MHMHRFLSVPLSLACKHHAEILAVGLQMKCNTMRKHVSAVFQPVEYPGQLQSPKRVRVLLIASDQSPDDSTGQNHKMGFENKIWKGNRFTSCFMVFSNMLTCPHPKTWKTFFLLPQQMLMNKYITQLPWKSHRVNRPEIVKTKYNFN